MLAQLYYLGMRSRLGKLGLQPCSTGWRCRTLVLVGLLKRWGWGWGWVGSPEASHTAGHPVVKTAGGPAAQRAQTWRTWWMELGPPPSKFMLLYMLEVWTSMAIASLGPRCLLGVSLLSTQYHSVQHTNGYVRWILLTLHPPSMVTPAAHQPSGEGLKHKEKISQLLNTIFQWCIQGFSFS